MTFPPGTAPDPGGCLVCGTVKEDTIYFDRTSPWDGALLICKTCLRYVLTFKGPEYFELVTLQQHKLVEEQLNIAVARIQNFESARDAFTNEFADAVGRFNSSLASGESIGGGSGLPSVRSESIGAEPGDFGDFEAVDL